MKHHHDSTSEIVQSNLPCPACGSRNNVKLYSDGHSYCFGCGDHRQGDGTDTPHQRRQPISNSELLPFGELQGIPKRKITQDTCSHFGYHVSKYKGTPAQVAPYVDRDGHVVAQKVRLPGKDFKWLGADQKTVMPFGYHCFPRAGKAVVITEGEVDALSFSQVQGNKYAVWSIPTGAGPQLRKWLAARKDDGIFDSFDKVVVMFDSDEKGREAAAMAAEIIGSRVVVAELPLKDANEMLVAGRTEELVKAFWNAKPYRPEGIVDLADLRADVSKNTGAGVPLCYAGLNRITYGCRTGELIGIGAGAGAGKTDFLTEIARGLVVDQGESVGAFFLESTPVELARRFAGKMVDKTFHIPDSGWTEADYDEAWATLRGAPGRVYLYDSFGVNEWSAIKAKIEYLHHAHGVKFFILDHLTAFAAADPQNERQVLEEVMGDMGSLVKKIPITIFFVSHLATPEGKPHEEGGHISLRHFKGARAIGFWAHIAFGLERNQQAEDRDERMVSTVRCVKNRPFGHLNGEVFYLKYDPGTGRLNEIENPESPRKGASAFTDETEHGVSDF